MVDNDFYNKLDCRFEVMKYVQLSLFVFLLAGYTYNGIMKLFKYFSNWRPILSFGQVLT